MPKYERAAVKSLKGRLKNMAFFSGPPPATHLIERATEEAKRVLAQIERSDLEVIDTPGGQVAAYPTAYLREKLKRVGHSRTVVEFAICRLLESGFVEVYDDMDSRVGDEPYEFLYLCEQLLFVTADSLVDPANLTGKAVVDWPKPKGWDFRPGEAAFNGHKFPIQRKHKALLERFVKARGAALTIEVLNTDVWGEAPAEATTIRGYISTLRTLLKRELRLDTDPLPIVDEAAYRLII